MKYLLGVILIVVFLLLIFVFHPQSPFFEKKECTCPLEELPDFLESNEDFTVFNSGKLRMKLSLSLGELKALQINPSLGYQDSTKKSETQKTEFQINDLLKNTYKIEKNQFCAKYRLLRCDNFKSSEDSDSLILKELEKFNLAIQNCRLKIESSLKEEVSPVKINKEQPLNLMQFDEETEVDSNKIIQEGSINQVKIRKKSKVKNNTIIQKNF